MGAEKEEEMSEDTYIQTLVKLLEITIKEKFDGFPNSEETQRRIEGDIKILRHMIYSALAKHEQTTKQ